MLKKQDISGFLGYGQGSRPGKYFFSSGFRHSDRGAIPSRRIANVGSAPATEQYWFAQRDGTIFSVGDDGDICINGAVTHAVSSSLGNGLIVDQKNRLLYARREFLGMFDGTTWTDGWKDFDLNIPEFRPMELFYDMVLIGNRNKVAALFTSDDSFNAEAFNLPSSFTIRAIKAGKTGVLIGANHSNRSHLILWDGQADRSIAPWIPLPDIVLSITSDDNGTWLVTTRSQIYRTNGYSLEPFAEFPVKPTWNLAVSAGFYRGNVLPGGTAYEEGRLYVAFTPDEIVPKLPLGLLVFDSMTGLWEHATIPQAYLTEGYIGAVFLDSALRINVSYGTATPTVEHRVGRLDDSNGKKSILISDELGVGNNPKYAEALVLNVRYYPEPAKRHLVPLTRNWSVRAKIYDFKRPLYGFGLTSAASTVLNQLRNTGSNAAYKGTEIGDEVTILNGVNAGESRQIIDITDAGTDNETWVLDEALPNLSESGRESGAAIAESEFQNAYAQYLPKPGDDAKTIANKKANMNRVLSNFQQEAGPAWSSGGAAPTTDSLFQQFESNFMTGPLKQGQTPYLKTLGAVTGPNGSSAWKWGLDVDIKKGDPVKSPVSGTVIGTATGYNGGFGGQVKIKADDGREIWLSHFDAINVKKGQRVAAGQVIAKGGNTGKVIKVQGGDGSHVDITMPKPGGGYYTAPEVRKYLSTKYV